MKNMFSLRSSSYDLRGNYILSLSKPKTTTYGRNFFSYFSAKQWNAPPDFFRTSQFFCRLNSDLTQLNHPTAISDHLSLPYHSIKDIDLFC